MDFPTTTQVTVIDNLKNRFGAAWTPVTATATVVDPAGTTTHPSTTITTGKVVFEWDATLSGAYIVRCQMADGNGYLMKVQVVPIQPVP